MIERKAGDRVKVGLGGRKMTRANVEAMDLQVGDKVLCIDPDSEMRRNEETEMLWTVRENTILRIARNGIRTKRTSHNYLRTDGVWSNDDDEGSYDMKPKMVERKVEMVDDSIIITDSSELLAGRADISYEKGETKLHPTEATEPKTDFDKRLELDKKRAGWKEPHRKSSDRQHVCGVCGTEYEGRPNKRFCGKKCRDIYNIRKYRAKKREEANFKPHYGKSGEVYFMKTMDRKKTVVFVPALCTLTRKKAIKHLKDRFPDDKNVEDYIEQVNQVIAK